MNHDLLVRKAVVGDAANIASLAEELGYPSEPTAVDERLLRILKCPNQLMIVAQLDRVCGWLQAHAADVIESGFRVEILGLVVGKGARRRGIGRRLVSYAEEWANEIGAAAIVVRSNVARAESHPFYAALGFSQTKTQAVYRKALGNKVADR